MRFISERVFKMCSSRTGSPLVVSSPVLWDPPVVACGLPPSLLLRGEMTRLPLPSGTLHRDTHTHTDDTHEVPHL